MSNTTGKTGTFDPRVMLGLIAFGAIAFFATLYFIGSGQTGGDINDGKAHAASRGLTGYAALVDYLEATEHEVALSRSEGGHDDYGLLVLTPPASANAEDIDAILDARRYLGPTLVILPKWTSGGIPVFFDADTEDGWVQLYRADAPRWAQELSDARALTIEKSVAEMPGPNEEMKPGPTWRGLGRSGRLPSAMFLMEQNRITPLVSAKNGATLAGYFDDGGNYPRLSAEAGFAPTDGDELDDRLYPVAFVVEPDLMNNYGFSSRTNAELAHALIDTLSEDGDMPVIFDLTLNGLGAQQNLLTLAFTPPFLAATLCLILALLVVAWRAFHRFGPPVVQTRAIAYGKGQLVANSAAFIQRSKRFHLLAKPYADMVQRRIVKALGLRQADSDMIDAALDRKAPGNPPFSQTATRLRNARDPKDILAAAAKLKHIERTVSE